MRRGLSHLVRRRKITWRGKGRAHMWRIRVEEAFEQVWCAGYCLDLIWRLDTPVTHASASTQLYVQAIQTMSEESTAASHKANPRRGKSVEASCCTGFSPLFKPLAIVLTCTRGKLGTP